MGHCILVKNWGQINCYHCDNHCPKGDYNTRARMNKGHVYPSSTTVYDGSTSGIVTKNFPSRESFSLCQCAQIKIGDAHMDIAMRGPSSCSAQIEECAQSDDLPYLGLPTLQRVRIPRAPPRRPAPRTPGSDQEPVATPAEAPMEVDDGNRQQAAQITDD
eukprot:3894678-Pyramimonas_sp.AAC.1